jgi:hypothetical protein
LRDFSQSQSVGGLTSIWRTIEASRKSAKMDSDGFKLLFLTPQVQPDAGPWDEEQHNVQDLHEHEPVQHEDIKFLRGHVHEIRVESMDEITRHQCHGPRKQHGSHRKQETSPEDAGNDIQCGIQTLVGHLAAPRGFYRHDEETRFRGLWFTSILNFPSVFENCSSEVVNNLRRIPQSLELPFRPG